MDENRVSGTAKNIGGKVEEGLGRFTGDTKTQAAGVAKAGQWSCARHVRPGTRCCFRRGGDCARHCFFI